MWVKSENGENLKPPKIEYSGNNVILRRNFQLAEETEAKPAHYDYEEWQMTRQQFEVYESLENTIKEQDDALVELAGLIAEVLE